MEKNNKKIHTNNMIALCHVVDEFEKFEKRLLPVISTKYNRDFVFQLWDVSLGKFKLGAKKAKKFYGENKKVIDTINKYSNLSAFINLNYDFYGKPSEDLHFFHKYLLSHKEDIPNILVLLEKLKELGFSKFEFNEELDFTKEMYDASPNFDRNSDITYVANAQVIPTYVKHINYKTTNSNYKMKLGVTGISNRELCEYRREIVLNSLLFDYNTLPTKLDKKHTFDQLLSLKNEQNEITSIIRSTVDLNIGISDLEHQFMTANGIVTKLDGIKNKEELIKVLSSIKDDVEKLKILCIEHNSIVSEQEPLLTSEVIEKEKLLYLHRRDMASIDWC